MLVLELTFSPKCSHCPCREGFSFIFVCYRLETCPPPKVGRGLVQNVQAVQILWFGHDSKTVLFIANVLAMLNMDYHHVRRGDSPDNFYLKHKQRHHQAFRCVWVQQINQLHASLQNPSLRLVKVRPGLACDPHLMVVRFVHGSQKTAIKTYVNVRVWNIEACKTRVQKWDRWRWMICFGDLYKGVAKRPLWTMLA